MEVLKVFATYTLIALVGVGVARVLVYLVLGTIKQPVSQRKKATELASESLYRATALRMDATALYEEFCGIVKQEEEEEEKRMVIGEQPLGAPRKVQRCL